MRRLGELTLSGFRVFLDEQTVPLDAGVVLVHGANGCGKSSLLHAIELCLTGRVADLEVYPNSYPDCLMHFAAPKSGWLKLRYQDENDVYREGTVTLQKSQAPKMAGDFLTRADLKHFHDRCYLSQSRLARLLEMYQAVDKEKRESPLATFVRELLGLDVLENITSGLEVTGDKRRIRRDIKAYADFEKEVSELALREESLQTKLRSAVQEAESAFSEDRKLSEGGSEISGAIELSDEELSETLNQLNADFNAIERAETVLRSLEAPEASIPAKELERELADRESIQKDLAVRLRQHLVEAGEFIGRPVSDETVIDDVLQLGEEWTSTLALCERKVSQLIVQVNSANKWLQDLAVARTAETEIDKEWEELSRQVEAEGRPDTEKPEAFRLLVDKIEGDVCPVCDRDYSELGKGSLVEHLRQKIESLLRREKLVANVLELQSRREKQRQLIGDMAKEEKEYQSRVQQMESALRIGRGLVATHAELTPLRDSWLHNEQMQRTAKSNLLRIAKASEQRTSELKRLVEIEGRNDVKSSGEQTDSLARAILLREFVSSRIKLLEGERESRSKNQKYQETIVKLRQEIDVIKKRRQQLKRIESRLDGIVESAKLVARHAAEEKGKIIDRVFSGTLNTLWCELFQRLVVSEIFHPFLPAPKIVRGRMETYLSAGRDGQMSYRDLAAVLSSGNLNTAALSLFLTLNMVEEPKHHVLILDDPVQNMDDIHVVNLGALLKAIVHQADRQLVVAVHDRALFDYLRIELGPTKPSESLITIQVEREMGYQSAVLNSERHIWQPDSVVFGGASA
ncbi:MAG TPA: AAA family ATPase [Pirellulaceae bacterium]|nr:AAA family ATPase [Pirellulaceae bacterium]HMO93566.1 AAA family ATPase [Pirellulaceae bacterium]HMP71115.1 AAA family ATPase [Pirellulaceae bacterium]